MPVPSWFLWKRVQLRKDYLTSYFCIFNLSLSTRSYLTDCKQAQVFPIINKLPFNEICPS